MSDFVIQQYGKSFYFAGDLDAFKEVNNLARGQEWYDQYEAELSLAVVANGASKPFRMDLALEAAKKAAGIE